MKNFQSDKSVELAKAGYHKPFEDLSVFQIGGLTYAQAEQVVPSGWWVLERANFGDFYVSESETEAYQFMDRQVCRFWRLAFWAYQPYYGIDHDPRSPLKIRGIWITPSEYNQHPELLEAV